jgi:hypothetical protein
VKMSFEFIGEAGAASYTQGTQPNFNNDATTNLS